MLSIVHKPGGIYNYFLLCTVSSSYQAPKVPVAGRGADRYLITKEQLHFFVRIGLSAVTMAEALGVSESTVRRRLR